MSFFKGNVWRYIKLHKPYWWKLTLGNMFSILQSLALIPIPWIFGKIIDKRIPASDYRGISLDCLIIMGLYLAYMGFLVTARFINLSVTKQVITSLRADIIAKLQQLSIGFYDKQNIARLHSSVIHDSERVDVMANFLLSSIFVAGLTAVVMLGLLFKMSWQLTVLIIMVIPAFYVSQVFFKRHLKKRHQGWKEHFDTFSATVQEMLQSIRLTRAYAMEVQEEMKMAETISSLSHWGVRMATFSSFYNSVMDVLMGFATVLVIFGASWLVLHGKFTVGDLVAYYACLGLLFNPIRNIFNSMDNLFGGMVALDSLYTLLDQPSIEPDRETGLEKALDGDVEFKDVTFAYAGGVQALNHVNVRVHPGQTVALVGRSGSGKTTFINLLLGFYRPQQGEIFIDNIALPQYKSHSLRSQMGVVPQEAILLSGTIRSNILFGKRDATDDEIKSAAELACADDFIMQTEEGYDTEIVSLGARLSGGQRQRLAIARAILRDPRILILDEATSALDSVSERAVQMALENLMRKRTTFIIAHRLSTVQKADLILVFADGHVVERGTHEELSRLGGTYTELARAQFAV